MTFPVDMVPEEVTRGLKACRDSGYTNMLDRKIVLAWLFFNNYRAASSWLNAWRSSYINALMSIEGDKNNE